MLTAPKPDEDIQDYLKRNGFGFAPSLMHIEDVHASMSFEHKEHTKLTDDQAHEVLELMHTRYRAGFGDCGYNGRLGEELLDNCLEDYLEGQSENSA